MSVTKPKTNKLLLTEFQKGNKKAFKKLFELFWEPMFVKAKYIVLDEDIAKDIVQDIWLSLWQKRENNNIKNFEAYIFKSINYGCFKYLRDNKLKSGHLQIIESLELTTESSVEDQHNLDQAQFIIEKSLTELPPRCQQIFRLSRMEAASNEEIAQRLGISKRSVENQMSIALKSIKQNLRLAQSSLTSLFIFITLL
ncbi:RNA polymerase sigma-70 factor [Flagellimonas pacifica]|uniref:RNA polymerase sigma-70 factor, ECF subfamily n=1 Tax=Flagellimonas pacifica TaxID=1247520 RepID=A0A285MWV6_9FLAO|nr:RNA polymerase sigma-70 factor [Allomuricauda parva]SNZ01665.1 RNA polymerase sigma-70 factor, ECF subfamily [Allomuricauda parva]